MAVNEHAVERERTVLSFLSAARRKIRTFGISECAKLAGNLIFFSYFENNQNIFKKCDMIAKMISKRRNVFNFKHVNFAVRVFLTSSSVF